MTLISDSGSVAELCRRLSTEPHVCVDTEFMRDRTYYPRLCLVQLAGARDAAVIDACAEGIDLSPVYELMNNREVVKVLHACRQDLEIFFLGCGHVPAPVFDTQIGAMVCGYGESISYDRLVARITGTGIDKGSRYTDWAKRPLSDAQIAYALSDVTCLRDVYRALIDRLQSTGRLEWLTEELAQVTDPATYAIRPEEFWRRLKPRNTRPRYLAQVRELAAWRECEAQRRDRPRAWVLRDDVLLGVAARAPKTVDELAEVRNIPERLAGSRTGRDILKAVARARALPDDACPHLPRETPVPRSGTGVVDLLRLLLKLKSEEHAVAERLIAGTADLDAIAAFDSAADTPALRGWRAQIFGDDALAVKNGRLALRVRGNRVELIRP